MVAGVGEGEGGAVVTRRVSSSGSEQGKVSSPAARQSEGHSLREIWPAPRRSPWWHLEKRYERRGEETAGGSAVLHCTTLCPSLQASSLLQSSLQYFCFFVLFKVKQNTDPTIQVRMKHSDGQ